MIQAAICSCTRTIAGDINLIDGQDMPAASACQASNVRAAVRPRAHSPRRARSPRSPAQLPRSRAGTANALSMAMSDHAIPVYQIDARWKIVQANDALCQALRCTQSGLIGRDVRELLRQDCQRAFQSYVARALVGAGDFATTVPLVAPCGEQRWFNHQLEPLIEAGVLSGYRASLRPLRFAKTDAVKRRWQWRPLPPHQVWNFEDNGLARA